MQLKPTFEVSKEGLAKLLERRGKAFAITELIQNCWDEDVTEVYVKLIPGGGRGMAYLEVSDNAPNGFADLSHAYTLFAESAKKSNPGQRGRFNLGEKLVIAMCQEAEIRSTTGTIRFTKAGREHSRSKTEAGSVFIGILRMNQQEIAEAERIAMSLIPPAGILTTFNGKLIEPRIPIIGFNYSLPTEISDDQGYLRRTTRNTLVSVYDPMPGEVATLYEMGIPVVETGDRWHVDIHQKVPLNTDRDNVTPAYLRDVRTAVLNYAVQDLTDEDAGAKWIDDALSDSDIEPEAVEAVMTKRFGAKRVVYDPSDPEANKLAVAEGYVVIPPRALSKEAWSSVRAAGAALPAGRVTPSPKPFDREGMPLEFIPPDSYSGTMQRMERLAIALADILMNVRLRVKFTETRLWSTIACYGRERGGAELIINVSRVQRFDDTDFLDLLIHEFGHEYESDHLSSRYHDALTRLGAKLAWSILNEKRTQVIMSDFGVNQYAS